MVLKNYSVPIYNLLYGSAIVIIIRGLGCGFGNSREDIVAWSDKRPSFRVLWVGPGSIPGSAPD
jgi:hypothetical protein